MTCHNQLELGEKKFRDAPVTESPHSIGVWSLKMSGQTILEARFSKSSSSNLKKEHIFQERIVQSTHQNLQNGSLPSILSLAIKRIIFLAQPE